MRHYPPGPYQSKDERLARQEEYRTIAQELIAERRASYPEEIAKARTDLPTTLTPASLAEPLPALHGESFTTVFLESMPGQYPRLNLDMTCTDKGQHEPVKVAHIVIDGGSAITAHIWGGDAYTPPNPASTTQSVSRTSHKFSCERCPRSWVRRDSEIWTIVASTLKAGLDRLDISRLP